jgi:hypothetical protein
MSIFDILTKLLRQTNHPEQEIYSRLKAVSINGRMAFGITCLEIYIDNIGMDKTPRISGLIETLWEFVSSTRLDVWESDVKDVLDELIWSNKEVAKLPERFATLTERVGEIGMRDLYVGTDKHSPQTLEEAMQVVTIMHEAGLPLPDLAPFEKSSFTEQNGWGNRVDKSFFRN